MWRRIAFLCGGFLIATVLASPLAVSEPISESRDLLGEGDVVRITVFQNPDLATEARLSEKGTINFPLIGEVVIGGLTPAGAEARIAQRLSVGKFVTRPQVNLTVLTVRSRQVSVLGEVGRPGRYALDNVNNRVTDVLAEAGGITPTGDEHVVVMLNRNGKTTRTTIDLSGMYRNGDLSNNVQLENGDSIYVERASQFYIYGEVQRSGAYRLEPNMTVMQALSVGGGLSPRGTLRGLEIQRKTADGKTRTIDVRPSDTVQADDVIRVRAALF
jgi:polysaccharide export outer membrane protein